MNVEIWWNLFENLNEISSIWPKILYILYEIWLNFEGDCKVNSAQEACAKCFVVYISKFEILQTAWKNKTKNIKMQDLLMKNWKLRVRCSLFHFFTWFAKFQILICELQNILRKLLELSWLYILLRQKQTIYHLKSLTC